MYPTGGPLFTPSLGPSNVCSFTSRSFTMVRGSVTSKIRALPFSPPPIMTAPASLPPFPSPLGAWLSRSIVTLTVVSGAPGGGVGGGVGGSVGGVGGGVGGSVGSVGGGGSGGGGGGWQV